jgi:hypothetical protein
MTLRIPTALAPCRMLRVGESEHGARRSDELCALGVG